MDELHSSPDTAEDGISEPEYSQLLHLKIKVELKIIMTTINRSVTEDAKDA